MSASVLSRPAGIGAVPALHYSRNALNRGRGPRAPQLSRRARLARTVLLGVAVVAVLVGVFAAVWSPSAAADGEASPVRTVTVVVDEGDSLWSVVSDRSYDRDLRDVLDEVRAINGMTTNVVHPGQKLDLPAR